MKIIAIEDSPVYRKLLDLQLGDFEVEAVSDAESALPIISERDEPLVLLIDWELPGMSGLDLLNRIRNQHRKHYVYAIVLSARTEKSDIVTALTAGADDYLAKPFNDQELQARIRVAFRTLNLHEDLVRANEQLEVLASQDPLTGLFNRRSLMAAFQREVLRARRVHSPITVVMCDVDHFKNVNDGLGHAAGDHVLKAIARALKTTSRGSDIVARTGGDEFVVVLPDSNANGAVVFVERTQNYLRDDKELRSLSVKITMSFGIAEMDPYVSEEEALRSADAALYTAKNGGRNQYHVGLKVE
ncbi:MAG TPA: diguanylate cyclase [candidate division Zixibacteria bacterium]|nr:diguanylate cyclase [candidate division Zixibacteria bacterium]